MIEFYHRDATAPAGTEVQALSTRIEEHAHWARFLAQLKHFFGAFAVGNVYPIQRRVRLARHISQLTVRCKRDISRALADGNGSHHRKGMRIDDRDRAVRFVGDENPASVR